MSERGVAASSERSRLLEHATFKDNVVITKRQSVKNFFIILIISFKTRKAFSYFKNNTNFLENFNKFI